MQINNNITTVSDNALTTGESISMRNCRGKKRKRNASQSSSDAEEAPLDTTVEADKSSNSSVPKNNAEDVNLKKVTKKVATNDQVLALVKLKEKEDLKLTRSKVKELMKVSPNSAPWDIENLELTPIKHIPVKTTPEVEALIAQELPEDEDDEEYEPTQDDVPSDDDQALESCSDLESQPHTPATPKQLPDSPQVVKDGPFKVPQDLKPVACRKLELEREEATIALRTRSKLSLSSTPIEHIESSFVPPDDLPVPDVDDLWNEFLEECLNPAPTGKNEDDDETDPEYNVAADPDAHDEDEEVLENSIIKISKKELNDLVAELFSIMPEATNADELADSLAKNVESENQTYQDKPAEILPANHWEGKQEPMSDEERQQTNELIERRDGRISVGKTEPLDEEIENGEHVETSQEPKRPNESTEKDIQPPVVTPNVVKVSVREEEVNVGPAVDHEGGDPSAPPLLRRRRAVLRRTNTLEIELNQSLKILPEQIVILQQQFRQHVQLATSNFLQLYVHPVHWSLAPAYKEYLQSLQKMAESNPKSVVNVCNLKPACDLITTWEKTVSEDTPENNSMVEFIQAELERSRRRFVSNSLYVGDFHDTFKNVVANSTVFLYPYLIPPMPYRPDTTRRFSYLRSEDELIALGLDEFWKYVEMNPDIFQRPSRLHPRHRWGLTVTCQLVCKHMFPWIPFTALIGHIRHVKKMRENPIGRFFAKQEVTPVKHKLLPFNPKLTLYEQPEHEIPRLWVRHLAKTSKRFRDHLYRRTNVTGMPPPAGEVIDLGQAVEASNKKPLPIDFIKDIPRKPNEPKTDETVAQNKVPTTDYLVATNFYSMVETSTGTVLVPLMMQTDTVTSNVAPICSTTEVPSTIQVQTTNDKVCNEKPKQSDHNNKVCDNEKLQSEHCECCVLIRKICKQRQTVITDYFKNNGIKKCCPCKGVRYPKISNNLKLFLSNYRSYIKCKFREVESKLNSMKNEQSCDVRLNETECSDSDQVDTEFVTMFLIKLNMRTNVARNNYIKKKLYTLLSRFDIDTDDPVRLANELYQMFDMEMGDLHKEFMAFLTPEQADKIDKFKDHFVITCVSKIIKKIEELVPEQSKRNSMLSELNTVLVDNMFSACEMCCRLLDTMHGYPKLANFIFNLFPHRHKSRESEKNENISESSSHAWHQKQVAETLKDDETGSPMMDYEADNSSNDEENSEFEDIREKEESPTDTKPNIVIQDLQEDTASNYVYDAPELTICKTEVQEPLNFSQGSCEISTTIVSEDEQIKTEAPDWTREEDKLILEVLKESLTPEERRNKTILEVIEDKQVPQIISESLMHKSIDVITERILYLLEILALSEH